MQKSHNLPVNTGERFSGVVTMVQRGEKKKDLYGFIAPDDLGARLCYFSRGDLMVTDVLDIPDFSKVEFEVIENEENPDRLRATNITGPGERLITNWRGAVGDFYRGRNIRHGSSPAAPLGVPLEGFICTITDSQKSGLIEITAKDGQS